MGKAVEQQRVKARIAQRDLEPGAGRRIAGEGRIDFRAQVFQKHRDHYIRFVAAAAQGRAAARGPSARI
jgi:hypothetical protein